MKAVFALCLLCLIQVSIAEEEQSLGEEGPEVQAVLDREARGAGRCKNNGKCRNGKCKNGEKCTKGRRGRGNKGVGRSGMRKEMRRNGKATKNTCLLKDHVTAIKKFSRASSELKSLNKINNFRKQMKGKKESANDTFADSAAAIKESMGGGKSCEGSAADLSAAKEVHDKLANCSMSAGANCDEKAAGAAINETALTSCNQTLVAFTTGFKKCYTGVGAQDKVCTCMAALVIPGDDCMDFAPTAKKIKAQKLKCTKGTQPGSFGDCRKQERMAAKYGNKCKKSCATSPAMTTSAPGGRVNMLRQLNQKMKLNLN